MMTSEKQTNEHWTILAQLVRPQGRHGEILADILTDFPQRFLDRKRLFLVSAEISREPLREVALENHWLHKERIVLKFVGVESIHDAHTLRRFFVAVPANERVTLTDDSFFVSDLVGCEIVDVNVGLKHVGIVTDVDREDSLLIVKTPQDQEVSIPFAKAYLVHLNIADKRIEMKLPPGLLEINAPMTEEERNELESPGGTE